MKVLVTGGCGFIGSRLVARLRSEGHAARVLDNLAVGRPEALADPSGALPEESVGSVWPQPGRVGLAVADVRDAAATRRACEGAEWVVHLAAETGVVPSVDNPRRDFEVNVGGTLNVLEAARAAGVRRVVFASSGAPLGSVEPPAHEGLAPRPASPYGASKLAGEAYCSAYFHSFGLETVALRFSNVYGPGSAHKSSVVARFLHRALSGSTLQIFGDGRQSRDLLYVDDAVDAIVRAASTPGVGGELFQIATSCETTLVELVDAVCLVLREGGLRSVRMEYTEARQGEVIRNYADNRKARERLGWSPRSSLEAGLRETAAWFAKRPPETDARC